MQCLLNMCWKNNIKCFINYSVWLGAVLLKNNSFKAENWLSVRENWYLEAIVEEDDFSKEAVQFLNSSTRSSLCVIFEYNKLGRSNSSMRISVFILFLSITSWGETIEVAAEVGMSLGQKQSSSSKSWVVHLRHSKICFLHLGCTWFKLIRKSLHLCISC